jgi:hypothetical protein
MLACPVGFSIPRFVQAISDRHRIFPKGIGKSWTLRFTWRVGLVLGGEMGDFGKLGNCLVFGLMAIGYVYETRIAG